MKKESLALSATEHATAEPKQAQPRILDRIELPSSLNRNPTKRRMRKRIAGTPHPQIPNSFWTSSTTTTGSVIISYEYSQANSNGKINDSIYLSIFN